MNNQRLKGERFEAKPKEVVRAANYRDQTGLLAHDNVLVDDLELIVACIERGKLLPPRFYRRGIERTEDQLLNEEGIKHLHLGGQESDVLVFIVEYEDRAVLLEVNSHIHFDREPIGSALCSLHMECLRQEDEAVRARKRDRIEARRKIVRRGLLTRLRARRRGKDDDAPPSRGL